MRAPASTRCTLAGLLACAALASQSAPATEDAAGWIVAGRQGLVQLVIVPPAALRDEAAYRAQIARICPPQATCFVNFHGNSQGLTPTVPLPPAIADEPTATFRRSAKQMVESFRWACRMQLPGPDCF